jgi:hypothetical protein
MDNSGKTMADKATKENCVVGPFGEGHSSHGLRVSELLVRSTTQVIKMPSETSHPLTETGVCMTHFGKFSTHPH